MVFWAHRQRLEYKHKNDFLKFLSLSVEVTVNCLLLASFLPFLLPDSILAVTQLPQPHFQLRNACLFSLLVSAKLTPPVVPRMVLTGLKAIPPLCYHD